MEEFDLSQKNIVQVQSENFANNLYVSNICTQELDSSAFFTTNNGYILCFHMNDYEPNPHYKREYHASPNLKRPIKSTFEN